MTRQPFGSCKHIFSSVIIPSRFTPDSVSGCYHSILIRATPFCAARTEEPCDVRAEPIVTVLGYRSTRRSLRRAAALGETITEASMPGSGRIHANRNGPPLAARVRISRGWVGFDPDCKSQPCPWGTDTVCHPSPGLPRGVGCELQNSTTVRVHDKSTSL